MIRYLPAGLSAEERRWLRLLFCLVDVVVSVLEEGEGAGGWEAEEAWGADGCAQQKKRFLQPVALIRLVRLIDVVVTIERKEVEIGKWMSGKWSKLDLLKGCSPLSKRGFQTNGDD